MVCSQTTSPELMLKNTQLIENGGLKSHWKNVFSHLKITNALQMYLLREDVKDTEYNRWGPIKRTTMQNIRNNALV